MRAAKVAPISRRALRMIGGFDEAARYYGWMLDQGSGPGVTHAELIYLLEKKRLERFIKRLEARKP